MKKTVTKRKPTVTKSFRLFDFHTYDGEILEKDSDDSSNDMNSESSNDYDSYFIIQMFNHRLIKTGSITIIIPIHFVQ